MGKFDDLVPNIATAPLKEVEQNDFVARDLNPDTEAEVLKLSKDFNTPVPFVRDNVEDFKKQAEAPKYGDLLKNNPKLTKFLARDVSNLAVSKDGLPELQGIEKRRDQFKTTDSFSKELSRAFVGGSNDLAVSTYLLGSAYGIADNDKVADMISRASAISAEAKKRTPDYVEKFTSSVKGDYGKSLEKFVSTNYYAELMEGDLKSAFDGFKSGAVGVAQFLDMARNALNTKEKLKGAVYSSVEQVANSYPSIAAGLGLGAAAAAVSGPLAPVTGVVGFAGGSFAGSYFTEVGSWIQSKMVERGVDLTDKEAVKAALSDANFMAQARAEAEKKGLGTAGVDAMFNLVAGSSLAKLGAKASIGKKIVAGAKDVTVQTFGEMASEGAGQKYATGKVNYQDVALEGLMGGFQSFADSTIGAKLRGQQEQQVDIPMPSVEGGATVDPDGPDGGTGGASQTPPTTPVFAQEASTPDTEVKAFDPEDPRLKNLSGKGRNVSELDMQTEALAKVIDTKETHDEASEHYLNENIALHRSIENGDDSSHTRNVLAANKRDLKALAKIDRETLPSRKAAAVPVQATPPAFDVEAATRKVVDGAEKAQKIAHDVMVIQDLGKMVRDSKLYQRSPEKMQELLDQLGEGNEATSVFFKAADFDQLVISQGLSPVKAAEQLLGDTAKYFESKENPDIAFEVPLSQFLTKAAKAENFDPLLSIMRTSPNGLTITEAQVVNKELPNVLAELTVAAEKQEARKKSIEQETLAIKKEVKQQLAQGGIFAGDQTDAAAETIASLYRTEQSDVYEGKSVAEIYRDNPVKLEYFNKVPEGVQALEQSDEASFKFKESSDRRDVLREELIGLLNASNNFFGQESAELAVQKISQSSDPEIEFQLDKASEVGKKAIELSAVHKDTIFYRNKVKGLYKTGKALISSKPFKKWFGKSKAIDADGNPIVFYHGTNADIKEFAVSQGGKVGGGVYLSPSSSEASNFGEAVYPVFVQMNKTLNLSDNTNIFDLQKAAREIGIDTGVLKKNLRPGSAYTELLSAIRKTSSEELIGTDADAALKEKLKAAGYDSIQYDLNGETAILVFNPTQIKSVNNQGTFDPANPNILLQADKQKTVRGFFDPLTKLVGLLKKDANISTPLHEVLGHMWLERMGENVDYLNALKQTQELTLKQEDYLKRAVDVLEFLEAKSFKEITAPQHEKWAAHFEAYLMEGKAPSKRLEGAFEKFKTWFTAIYKDILGLERDRKIKINLSDKLRNVFDRLLATEEEVAKAQSNYTPLLTDPISAGMSKELANKWYKVSSEASEAASNTLRKPVMDDYLKKQEKLYKEEAKKVREDLSNGLDKQSEQIALKAIETDKQVKDMPVEIQAEMYGYESVTAFEQAMDQARDARANIDAAVDVEMNKRYPDSLFELEEAAIEAVHNDKQAEKLRIEAEFLAEKMNDKQLAARLIARLPNSKILKEEAARRIGDKAIKDIKPYVFERAERAASKEAATAFKQLEGKSVEEAQELLQKAFDAKRRELLNHEMFKASIEAQKQVEKKIRDYKKLFKKNADLAKSRDIDYVNAARAVAANYGITRAEKSAEEYLDKLRKYEPARYDGLMNIINTASDGAGPYKDVSFSKFETMTRAVDALWSLSKSTEMQTVEGMKIERAQVISELQAESRKVLDKKGSKEKYDSTKADNGRFKTFGLKLKAALTRIEAWVDYMDGGNVDGAFRKYIWQPVLQSNIKYDLKKNEVLKTFRDVLRDYAKDMPKEEIVARELIGLDGRAFVFQSKFELLHAVLHTGNPSNKSKLLRGYGWGAEFDGVLDTSKWDAFQARMIKEGVLTKADFDFAQRVWNLMESFKGDLQKTHKELEGYYFEEVTSEGFKVTFADGSVESYGGGYIPAKVDTNKVKDFKKLEEIEIFEKNNPSMAFPTTGSGATKTRNEAFARRLSLDLNLLGAHMDWALRYTYFEPRVQEVSRLLNDQKMKDLLNEVDPEIKGALEAWLQRTAQQTVVVPSTNPLIRSLEPAARYFRTSAAMQVMFGNITNTIQQGTGLVVAMTKVKPRYIAQGFTTWLTGFGKDSNKAVDEMIEKSEYMNTIQGINIYETQNAITELIANPNKFQQAQEFAIKHTYILQTAAQNIVNTSTWWGAYNQAVAEKMSEKQAVQFADSTVRQTQGTNKAIDVAGFEVGGPVYRMFIQFAGYFNMLANLNAAEAGKIINEVGIRKGGGRLFYVYMMGFMLPAVMSELMVKAMSGRGFDEDDDDEYVDDFLAMFAGSQFKTATAMIPAVGSFAVAKYNRAFTDNLYDDRLNMSLAISTIDQITDFPVNLYKDVKDGSVDAGRTTKDFMTLIGVMTKTPVGLPAKQVKYLIDVSSGEAQPTGPIDFTRGLLTGKKGDN